jgi:pilus assembly protein CpaB
MKMKSLVLIFIALGCGLVASIGISQVMERGGSGGPKLEMEQILVALSEVDAGAKLDAQNIKLEDWPKGKIPEGAIRSLDEVKDKFTLVRFYKGEPIILAKISDEARNFTMTIPEGYRVMPVKVDDETVMKAVQVGDRVDVMVFLRRSDEITTTGSYPILRNVRLFAVGANTERSVDEKGKEVAVRTVSLLVKPKQAQELAVATQMGKIMLTLRPPNEPERDPDEDVIPIGDILSGKSSAADKPQHLAASTPAAVDATPAQGPGLTDWLTGLAKSAANGIPAAENTIPQPNKFVMHIFTPNDVRGFEWTDPNALPVETTVSGVTAGNTIPAPQSPPTQHQPAFNPTTTQPTTTQPTLTPPATEDTGLLNLPPVG